MSIALRKRFVSIAVLLIGIVPAALAGEDEPEPNKGGPKEFPFLKYRLVGPAAGGRVARSVGVPGDPLTYYAATAAGGVWKTSDGGINWKPIFDDQPISTIGSIAVAPSDPNVVYVGSGEANIRSNVEPGNGIYKSSDAGKTWQHVWDQEGQIGRIVVHPKNPDIAWAAVLGHAFGPNPERGIYRTTDGGKTWNKVLYKNPDTGAIDIAIDPSNPRILLAALWQVRRRPWELTSGGPGSGLYMSRDAGDTWKPITKHGLPDGIWGRIGLAFAPSDSRRIFALIEAEKGGLYRSDDGGDKWSLINGEHYLRQRPWYFSNVAVNPANADVVWCSSFPLLKSIDGGKTFKKVKGPHHVDHHDLWIDPKNPRRMIASDDGGVDISVNAGETWYAPPLPISQFYHVAADNRVPYHVSGTMQDLGTASGPSNSLNSEGIAVSDWYGVGGGETGFTAPDPSDPNIVYAGEYGGYLSRFDFRTRQAHNVSIYPTNPSGHGGEDLRYRFQWTAPILISPHDSKTIYHAANVLFRTTDAGQHWQAISPDLTRNDKSKQKWSGGPISGDNTGAEMYCTIFAIAESPKQKGLLWAGTDDGLVHISPDSGKHWENVAKNIPGMPEWGTVACIEASPFDAGTAYVVVDAHKMDDMEPHLFKTTDFGKTWAAMMQPGMALSIPPSNRVYRGAHLHAVREDPKCRGLLYVGTETGVLYSTGDDKWQPLKLNLPTVAVTDLVVNGDDLVVATNGRSIWILDDLNPLRALVRAPDKESVRLFPTAPAIRWRYHTPVEAPQQKEAGKNPPRGAIIDYYLKAKPKDPIRLEIRDAQGMPVRTLTSKPDPDEIPEDDPDSPPDRTKPTVLTTHPGVNRVAWDLASNGATVIPKAKVDSGDPKIGPLVLPGTYTLALMVDGKTCTEKLEVRPDPRTTIKLADIEEQNRFALTIRDDISHLAGIVRQLAAARSQLAERNALLKEEPKAQALVETSRELIGKFDVLEARLHNPKAKVIYDILAQRGGAQLYSKLIFLFEFAKDSDGVPTQGMREVYAEQQKELAELQTAFQRLVTNDVARVNTMAKGLDVPAIILPASSAAKASQKRATQSNERR